MKRNLLYVLATVIGLSIAFSACKKESDVNVTNVTLNKTTHTMTVDDQETLVATVVPENATDKTVTWTSSDTAVATVDNGVVKALIAGETTITVTTVDGGHKATCTVTVAAAIVPVTGVTLDKTTLTMGTGDEQTLVPTVAPEDATNKNVTWTSSDTAVATVANGVVTAVGAGNATITATTEDGSHTATCAVTVIGVTLNKTELTLMTDKEETLVATVLPENAANKNVTWTSSNTAVATVNNGVVKGVSDGEAVITVTTEDGNQTATCAVTVSWLGEVSFKTATTWTIGDQTWSDAVMAVRCRKDDYHGGVGLWTTPEYRIDCRQNEGYGDWFSWRAVDTYKAQLCPDGWRVPTSEDFKNLDIAMGGSGEGRSFDGAFIQRYIDEWGGEMGGYVWVHYQTQEVTPAYVGEYGFYWTQVEEDDNRAKAFQFGDKTALVLPEGGSDKYNGGTIRCVK